jgi:murein DD-endopeptidase MepM/ murein hydrolase activator NlpD
MTHDRYYVKIVPQRGDSVHRFAIRRRHIIWISAILGAAILTAVIFAGVQVWRANTDVSALQQKSDAQTEALQMIDQQTVQLRKELQRVEQQNQQVKELIGVRPQNKPRVKPSPVTPQITPQKTTWLGTGSRATAVSVETNLTQLSRASATISTQSDHNRTLAMRVLNIRRIEELARARMIAAIPSIDPVDGAPVVGCFCYRSYPSSEFHEGVDLAASDGQMVRAAAAGTILKADWDGAYGLKVEIDHGNGYHTWYAHLSRIDVRTGEVVFKGQPIALVGETGFATGPHLHYQVMYFGIPIDPAPFLHGIPADVLAGLP